MKLTPILLATAFATPVLLAVSAPRDAVSFAPAEGASVTKTFASTVDFTLDDMSMLMNGEDMGDMMPAMDMEMTMSQTITVTDEYGSTRSGVPVKLMRTFDEIGQEMEVQATVDMMGQSQDNSASGSGSSELEGKTIVFEWDEDEEEHSKSFGDDDGDEEMLEGLTEDMDLRALLPSEEVSEGDEWDIDLKQLITIMGPGGDLGIDVEIEGLDTQMPGPDPSEMTDIREMFGDLIEGDATATYVGSRDLDGVSVAVIQIAIEVDGARDMSELVESDMAEQVPEGMEMNLERMDVEFSLEATGELFWNSDAGHVQSFEMTGELGVVMDMEVNMDMGGQAFAMEMTMDMSGTVNQSVSTE